MFLKSFDSRVSVAMQKHAVNIIDPIDFLDTLWKTGKLLFLKLNSSVFIPSFLYRYLENGVWDMVAVNQKQIKTKYPCCDIPFSEVQYRLIFKRQPGFYMKYLIVPVFLLSLLSTLVFSLPPDSGEKLHFPLPIY